MKIHSSSASVRVREIRERSSLRLGHLGCGYVGGYFRHASLWDWGSTGQVWVRRQLDASGTTGIRTYHVVAHLCHWDCVSCSTMIVGTSNWINRRMRWRRSIRPTSPPGACTMPEQVGGSSRVHSHSGPCPAGQGPVYPRRTLLRLRLLYGADNGGKPVAGQATGANTFQRPRPINRLLQRIGMTIRHLPGATRRSARRNRNTG